MYFSLSTCGNENEQTIPEAIARFVGGMDDCRWCIYLQGVQESHQHVLILQSGVPEPSKTFLTEQLEILGAMEPTPSFLSYSTTTKKHGYIIIIIIIIIMKIMIIKVKIVL
jgi:hypothetical protein